MMKNACSVDNVVGRLLGLRESKGLETSKEVIQEMSDGEKMSYNYQTNENGEEAFNSSKVKGGSAAIGHPQENIVKRILVDQAGPNEILGDQLIDELNELMTGYAKSDRKGTNGKQFVQDAKRIFENYEHLYEGTAKEGYFKEYRAYIAGEGGILYKTNFKTGIGEVISNITNNTIKSSFNIAFGNPLEVMIKLPALYPKHTAEGLANWISNGHVLRKIPELDRIGFYGLERLQTTDGALLSQLNKRWEGLNQTLDIPWKNLVYHTGAIKGGREGGLKAVERVLFVPRLANVPRQRWNSAGGLESRLLNYSINSIKLGVDLLNRARKGEMDAILGLAIMTGGITALGGPGSLIPKGIEEFLTNVTGGDWENPLPKWGASKLLQQTGVGRVGVVYDITNKQIKKVWDSLNNAGEDAYSGDYWPAAVNLAHAIASSAAFTNNVMGDFQVQKAMGIAKDLILDEMDEDLWDTVAGTYFPFAVGDDE